MRYRPTAGSNNMGKVAIRFLKHGRASVRYPFLDVFSSLVILQKSCCTWASARQVAQKSVIKWVAASS